jgi:hypothetical protein
MAVGLPGKASLEASIFFTVYKVCWSVFNCSPQSDKESSLARASAFWDHTSAIARTP